MIDAFSLTGVAKWNVETLEYEPYELPGNRPFTLPPTELETETNCAGCGKKVIFGSCYISKTIQSQHGFHYPVCEDCHNKELEDRRNK